MGDFSGRLEARLLRCLPGSFQGPRMGLITFLMGIAGTSHVIGRWMAVQPRSNLAAPQSEPLASPAANASGIPASGILWGPSTFPNQLKFLLGQG